MKENLRFVGALFIFVGGFFILQAGLITGNVISGDSVDVKFEGLIGVAFLVLGGVLVGVSRVGERKEKEGGLELTTRKEKSLAKLKTALDRKNIGSYEDLRKIASKVGYEIIKGKKHYIVHKHDGGTLIGAEGHPVTIPRGSKAKKGTYLSILEDLYDGAMKNFA
jgi:hypothetical protein